jgi:hypothetical protein
MAAHRSTGKQRWRSTDTRSHWTDATVRPTASGREMSPLQLYNTRTRAKQTFVPADPSGQVGLIVCGPTVYDLPHLGHAKTYTRFDFLVASYGAAASPSRTCRTSPMWTTRSSSRARELGIDVPELARRYERAYLDDMRALRNDSVDVYARASDYVDEAVMPRARRPASRCRRRGSEGVGDRAGPAMNVDGGRRFRSSLGRSG